jgi:hypothetical protein
MTPAEYAWAIGAVIVAGGDLVLLAWLRSRRHTKRPVDELARRDRRA